MAPTRPPAAPKTPGANVQAFMQKNKTPLLAAAGVVVAGAALLASRRGQTGTAAAGAATQYSDAATGYTTGYGTGGGSAYDSTASDVYNAIQPQIEALQRLWERQSDTPPLVVPADPDTPSYGDDRRNTIAGYYRTILGREPERVGLNFWDGTGKSLEEIRAGIARSKEASTTTRPALPAPVT